MCLWIRERTAAVIACHMDMNILITFEMRTCFLAGLDNMFWSFFFTSNPDRHSKILHYKNVQKIGTLPLRLFWMCPEKNIVFANHHVRLTTRAIMVMVVITVRAAYWLLEQPSSSKLTSHPELKYILDIFKKYVNGHEFVRLSWAYIHPGKRQQSKNNFIYWCSIIVWNIQYSVLLSELDGHLGRKKPQAVFGIGDLVGAWESCINISKSAWKNMEKAYENVKSQNAIRHNSLKLLWLPPPAVLSPWIPKLRKTLTKKARMKLSSEGVAIRYWCPRSGKWRVSLT